MKRPFCIQPDSIHTNQASLYLEIDAHGLSYTILENHQCLALVVYHFGHGHSDDTIAEYIHQVMTDQPVLHQKFDKVHIIYGYAPSVLVPNDFMPEANNEALIELVYGDNSERVTRSDNMYKRSLHNIYGVPGAVDQALNRYFPTAMYTHLFSLLPDIEHSNENQLYCIFSAAQLKVLVLKEGRLQVMQTYNYKTSEDAAYHLLNLCNSFEIPAADTLVTLTGMIETSSGLYSELYKYFLRLELELLPEQYQYPDGIKEFPQHYFSHLFAIAACV